MHTNRAYTTIVVGEGIHHVINRGELVIPSAMNIEGDPRVDKSEIVVVGGIMFHPGTGHLQHLIISHARYCGVVGRSFTMDDVVVQNCELNGVVCMGGIVKCNNVLVQECRSGTGVSVINGGSITLVGLRTKVCHNNQGLVAYGLSSVQASVIKVVSPMTKELVSTDNISRDFSNGVFSIGSEAINEVESSQFRF